VDRLIDNTRWDVAEQVAVRLGARQSFRTLSLRLRRIARDLAQSCSTKEVARKHGVTASRISQMRRELLDGWRASSGGGCGGGVIGEKNLLGCTSYGRGVAGAFLYVARNHRRVGRPRPPMSRQQAASSTSVSIDGSGTAARVLELSAPEPLPPSVLPKLARHLL